MEKIKTNRWAIVIIIIVIVLLVALVFIPFRKNITKDIDIVHYVNSEAVEEGTLSVSGELTYKIFSDEMFFSGDVSIDKIEVDLLYTQVDLFLKKNEYAITPIIIAGVDSSLPSFHNLGFSAIYGEFEKFVFSEQEPNTTALILSPEDYWTNSESSAVEVFATIENKN